MEQSDQLFSLSIDHSTKSHLNEAAKWARFLAIAGMVSLVLLVILGFYMSSRMAATMEQFEEYEGSSISRGIGVGMAIIYLVIAVIGFFPLMYLMKFASQMRNAIAANNQEYLNSSFQNLKICFRYLGIVTIIGIAFYLLSILITLGTTM